MKYSQFERMKIDNKLNVAAVDAKRIPALFWNRKVSEFTINQFL